MLSMAHSSKSDLLSCKVPWELFCILLHQNKIPIAFQWPSGGASDKEPDCQCKRC